MATFKYLSSPRLIFSSSSATSLHSRRMSSACFALRGVILTLKGVLPSDCAAIFVVSIGCPYILSDTFFQRGYRHFSEIKAVKKPRKDHIHIPSRNNIPNTNSSSYTLTSSLRTGTYRHRSPSCLAKYHRHVHP